LPRVPPAAIVTAEQEYGMNPRELAFDIDTIIAGLRPWVECESPTHDAAAVDRCMDLAARELALMGATIERIPGRMGYGGCVRARLPHKHQDPGILVMGHLDTVHPVGTLGVLPFRRDGGRCWGPGIMDMKGGNYIALEALRGLARAGVATNLPVTVLLTPDEEVGSPSTRDLIEAEAARHRYVLVPEPSRPDGGVVTGRYAIARFNLQAIGKPSHAGARLADGRSAISEMARQILAIEAMTTPDATFSVGVLRGGEWVNCVATTCTAQALTMAKRQPDLDRAVAAMEALKPIGEGVQFRATKTVVRPVWEPDAATMALWQRASDIAQSLGFAIPPQSSGGGSDANFTGAMGIPSLDGLGLGGAGPHTLDEHIDETTVLPRTRLMAGLLATLD
jgi:glutamate carboxypeptidase